MVGALVTSCSDSEEIVAFDESYRTTKKYGTSLDVVTMTELMAASVCDHEFSFEDLATADGAKEGETLRSSGFILSGMLIIYLQSLLVTPTGKVMQIS